jgi:hypothetical protein
MRRVPFLAAALAAALACCAPVHPPDPGGAGAAAPARDVDAAARFEAWMQPRLDAVQTMLDASQHGVEFVALVLRARAPGTGAVPPPLAPAAAGIARAEDNAGRRLDGLAPLPEGDREQRLLAAESQEQAARMRAGLAAFVATLPALAEVGGGLGPLNADETAALGESLLRLLDIQVRADTVFAALVIGLLTPESEALPEREIQHARWRGNAILLTTLEGLRTGTMPSDALLAALAAHRRDIDTATRKLEALRAAALGVPRFQAGALDRVIRGYEDGLDAEEEFLAAVAQLAMPSAGRDDRLADAFDGVRRLMDRLVHRLRVNIDRLRLLGDIGGGRRA